MTDLNEDDVLKLIQLRTLLLLLQAFSSLSVTATSTPATKTTPNDRLHRKTRWMKPFSLFALSFRDFALYGTAHTELLCVCH